MEVEYITTTYETAYIIPPPSLPNFSKLDKSPPEVLSDGGIATTRFFHFSFFCYFG
jgi:hypothetical protein